MKFNWKVFAVALMFSFVVSALSQSSSYLLLLSARVLGPQIGWLWPLVKVGSFIISPFLLFASFYLIGRNIDLVSDFPSVIVSLFIGSWAGQLIGSLLLFLYTPQALSGSASYVLWQYLWTVVYSLFSFEFFVGFTALAVAYIIKNVRTTSKQFERTLQLSPISSTMYVCEP
jgi:hypothetical protein